MGLPHGTIPGFEPIDPVNVKIRYPAATPRQIKELKEAIDLRNLELAIGRTFREDADRARKSN